MRCTCSSRCWPTGPPDGPSVRVPLARALVTLAAGSHPDTALGATDDPATTSARMRLLTEPPAPAWLRAAMVVFAVGVLAAPVALLVVAVG